MDLACRDFDLVERCCLALVEQWSILACPRRAIVQLVPDSDHEFDVHTISIVVPVYQGADTLPALVRELLPMTVEQATETGHRYIVKEILLVDDCGPDNSAPVLRKLETEHGVVRTVWLSRNFGQHAATLAGMASTASDWIVTLDEDGQHDPASIPDMLDVAMRQGAAVVYADPQNQPTHGWMRNTTSAVAKWVFVKLLSSERQPGYHSFRLILGEVGRSVAAYSGSGIYLDVALGWVTQRFALCPVMLRPDEERRSGYSFRSLMSHFWRLVLTSGTRPLRIMSVIGAVVATIGFVAAGVILAGRLAGAIEVQGWASLSVVLLVGIGLVLFTLGIAAEYVGVAARMAMGKPPFLIVSDQKNGPLGRTHPDA